MPLELLIERTSRNSKSFGSAQRDLFLAAANSSSRYWASTGVSSILSSPKTTSATADKAKLSRKLIARRTSIVFMFVSPSVSRSLELADTQAAGCTAQNQQPKLGRRRT